MTTISFNEHGHLNFTPLSFYECVEDNPRNLIDNALLSATPRVFQRYDDYCRFMTSLARALHVHPRSLVVRGSALLGFSVCPRPDKAWRAFGERTDGKKSDLDVAIVDPDHFERLDSEVREWEARNEKPDPASQSPHASIVAKLWARRATCRVYNYIDDTILPPSTCQAHQDALLAFDTSAFCDGQDYDLNAFIFRDWWSVRKRWEKDLSDLRREIKQNKITHPADLESEAREASPDAEQRVDAALQEVVNAEDS